MGVVFDIQKCSYHDGPGIRTTVFLKGCNLRCAWCHNPESFLIKPQLRYYEDKCIHCGKCQSACPLLLHKVTRQQHDILFDQCILCKSCIAVCPTGALDFFGEEMSAEDVMQIVLQDRAYYEMSDGGITISGGEATMQSEFLLELLQLSKKHQLHTCLETNGFIEKSYLSEIVPYVDLFLLDYKVTDSEIHHTYTNQSDFSWNETIQILQYMNKKVILRMPIIPGINDTNEHFEAAKQIMQNYSVIQSVELMPYHALGSAKWKQIGLTYTLEHIEEPSKEVMHSYEQIFNHHNK